VKNPSSVRGFATVGVLMLVVVGATGCGSSSKKGASGSATTASSSGQGANASTGSPTTLGTLHGNSGSSFCDLARQDQAAFSSKSFATMTPAQVKQEYQNLGSALEEARSAAPSAIKGDFDTFVTAFKPFLDVLASVNYDFTKMTPALAAKLQAGSASLGTAQVNAASAHITQYMEQVCKITTTPST
jgi:ABC-type transport system substrate-binding protein